MEPFAAVLAGVGPGVRMDQQVGGQCGTPLESLATLLAGKDALVAMHGSKIAREIILKIILEELF